MATVQGQCAATGLPLVAAVLAEGLFYAGVAALWLLIIQWDLLDRLLGGPGTGHWTTSGTQKTVSVSCASCGACTAMIARLKLEPLLLGLPP